MSSGESKIEEKQLLIKKNIYKTTGVFGVLGCFGVVAGDIIGILVHEDHNPISNTISMLAIGKYGWIQDLGLDLLALGFLSLAAGLFSGKRSGIKWIAGIIVLVLIGVDLLLIAEHNQYAGRPGYTIHRKLVYALALLFPTSLFLLSSHLKILRADLKKFCFWTAGLWLAFAPLMPLIPTTVEGAYERAVSSLIVIWLFLVSCNLFLLGENK